MTRQASDGRELCSGFAFRGLSCPGSRLEPSVQFSLAHGTGPVKACRLKSPGAFDRAGDPKPLESQNPRPQTALTEALVEP